MKLQKQLILFFFLLLNFSVKSQSISAVTTKEAFPNGEKDLTIIIDLRLAKDGRASGLLGKNSDIFMWSGAGDDALGNAFKYTPNGQANFNQPYEPGRMTALGNDKWSITINPRKYYNVPATASPKIIGIVVKNGAGNAQTEDLFLKLFDGALNMKIIEPTGNFLVAKATEKVKFRASFSETADYQIYATYKTNLGESKTNQILQETNKDSINITIDFTLFGPDIEGQKIELNFELQKGINKKSEKFIVQMQPKIIIEALPIGVKNGLNYVNETTVILSLFAPQKQFVYLLGDFNNWQQSTEYLLKKDPNSETFWIQLENLTPGKEYAYQYLVDGVLQVADPFSEKILDPNNDKNIPMSTYPNLMPYPTKAQGIVSVLQTGQQKYIWKTLNFSRPKAEQLIVYELLIRDFTVEGTYKAAQDRIPYLKNLGVNAIELMPVSEFSNNDSWGYNPTFYNAVDKAYGTKTDLKNFIDECHKNGIAVIIDMVLNQADDAFPYVQLYAENGVPKADSPYFNVTATHPFSVFRDFNHESKATQSLVDQVNKFWLEEFNIDGFRFDLSKGFTQKVNTDVAAWSNYDASRIAIWKRIYDEIRKTDKTAYVILEHFANNSEEQELAEYGMLFWGNANGDYRNTLKGNTADLSNLSHKVRNWKAANLIGYMESHDEERLLFDTQKNGQTAGSYSTKDLNTSLERAKAAAACFFLTEGPKMIWQFGEIGYDISIDENGRTGRKPVKWDYFDVPNRKKLYQTYAALLKAKLELEKNNANFTYRLSSAVKQTTIQNTDNQAIIIANLGLNTQSFVPEITAGQWYDYFTGTEFTITADDKMELKPGEFHIYTKKKLNSPETNLVPWAAFTKEQLLGNEPSFNLELKISPNPSADKIEVSFKGIIGKKYELEITDITGKIVSISEGKSIQTTVNQEIDIKKIPSGIYFLKVKTEGKLQTGKFLKE